MSLHNWQQLKLSEVLIYIDRLVMSIESNIEHSKRLKALELLDSGSQHIINLLEDLKSAKPEWTNSPKDLKQMQDLLCFKFELQVHESHFNKRIFDLLDELQANAASTFIDNNSALPHYCTTSENQSHQISVVQYELTNTEITQDQLLSWLSDLKRKPMLTAKEIASVQAAVQHVRANVGNDHLLNSFVNGLEKHIARHINHHKSAFHSGSAGFNADTSSSQRTFFSVENGVAKSFRDIKAKVIDEAQSRYLRDRQLAKFARKNVGMFTLYKSTTAEQNHLLHEFTNDTVISQFKSRQFLFGHTSSRKAAAIAVRIALKLKWRDMLAWGDNVYISELHRLCAKHGIKMKALNQSMLKAIQVKTQIQINTTTNSEYRLRSKRQKHRGVGSELTSFIKDTESNRKVVSINNKTSLTA